MDDATSVDIYKLEFKLLNINPYEVLDREETGSLFVCVWHVIYWFHICGE